MKFTIFAICIVIFTTSLTAQTTWQKYGNPVMGTLQGFSYAIDPSVLYNDSTNQYEMWFSGVNETYYSGFGIYRALSPDGVQWTLNPLAPVLIRGNSGNFDENDVRVWEVIKDDGQYLLYYLGAHAGLWQSGVATSSDGISWTKYINNPIITVGYSGAWNTNYTGYGTVIKQGPLFKMWHAAYDGVSRSQTGYATSSDGLNWTEYFGNPIFETSEIGNWDAGLSVLDGIVFYNGVYFGCYVGNPYTSSDTASTGFAYSLDGIHWTKYFQNPVITRSQSGWDNAQVVPASLLLLGDSLKLWYGGKSLAQVWQTGYATSKLDFIPPSSDSTVVAYWHFDEGAGTVLHDSSGYHNDGIIYNATWVQGIKGYALHFDGLTSYVALPNPASLKLQDSFTIEAVISLDTLRFTPSPYGSHGVIVSNLGPYPSGGGYQLGIEDSGKFSFAFRAEGSVSNFSDVTFLNRKRYFYHVATSYERRLSSDSTVVVKTYVNGTLTDSSVFSQPVQYTYSDFFYIGTNRDGRAVGGIGVREFPGIIDEIRISNKVLSPAQFLQFTFANTWQLSVTDAASHHAQLQFGVAEGATDGIDAALGEDELPPVPPAGNFDARWVIPGTQGSAVNFQDTLGGPHTENDYVGTFQPSAGGYPVQISWDPQVFIDGTFLLRDAITHGSLYTINMRAESLWTIPSNTTPLPFEIVYKQTPTTGLHVVEGWNMLSLAVTVGSTRVGSLFPTAQSHAYYFDVGYLAADTLRYGTGYWIKFNSDQNFFINGTVRNTDTLALKPGWNMIGTISAPVDTGSVVQIPPGIIGSKYYYYQGGYFTSGTLEPFKSYWVKAKQSGKMILSSNGKIAPLNLPKK